MSSKTVILGAGLSGLSAAYHLNSEYEIYDKMPKIGGMTRSIFMDGFTFDHGPHILYTVNDYAAQLIKGLLGSNFSAKDRESWIYHKKQDNYTRFPFQAHLYGLPVPVVKDCILGLFEAIQRDHKGSSPKNYKEWIVRTFGEGIARHLMIPYSVKLWTVTPDEMNYEWIGRRVPQPKLESILDGALQDSSKRVGFNNEFWYPVEGGIEALPRSFLPYVKNINVGMKAVEIKAKKHGVIFTHDREVYYEKLISSLPLPELIKLMDDVPPPVREASKNLMHNSILCVNLGIDRPNISDKHWVYFYEDGFSFHRISFPMNFSSRVAPKNTSSISTEISYSDYKKVEKGSVIERTIEELIRAKILTSDDKILVADVLNIVYAYIIYDHDHRKNVDLVHEFLHKNDIYPCGRFGEWEYLNMDHSIMSGKKIAEKVNKMSE